MKYDEPTRADNSYHVVTGATGATLDGFTITAGNANALLIPTIAGGGMYNYHSSPTLTNVTFSGNSASVDGGGMYNTCQQPDVDERHLQRQLGATDGGGMYN